MIKLINFAFVCFIISFQLSCNDGYITWIAVRLPLPGNVAAPGAPWPLPQRWENSSFQMTLDPEQFTLRSNVENCDVVENAFRRYSRLIKLDPRGKSDPNLSVLRELVIDVGDVRCGEDYYPLFESNETYSLTVSNQTTVTVHAATIWAALRGLETFSQLVYLTDDNLYRINQTHIEDYPRYSYRGLMIDTARHFYPVNVIIKILDAMSWDKFNVLHWHIVDDQSFPYQSRTYPNLTMGAFTPHHIYSQENISTVLHEARLRGIRVIPEFDTPGHTWSWGRAFPNLITPCWGAGIDGGPNVPKYGSRGHGPEEIINPMLNETYEFMRSLFEEIVQVFPDEYVHLGMDEAYHACWESSPNISAWMNEMGFTMFGEVEQYYARRLIEIIQQLSRTTKYIIWQDPIENNVTVDKDTVVEMWKDISLGPQFDRWEAYTKVVAELGYNLIISAPWYLNYINYGQDWKTYYLIEPENFTGVASEKSLVKGGEACAWSEYIDSTNFFSTLWPRASAVAERLWSSESERDVDSAAFRLDQQRCRMVRRGVEAKPILNGYCGDYEWDPPRKEDWAGSVTDSPTATGATGNTGGVSDSPTVSGTTGNTGSMSDSTTVTGATGSPSIGSSIYVLGNKYLTLFTFLLYHVLLIKLVILY